MTKEVSKRDEPEAPKKVRVTIEGEGLQIEQEMVAELVPQLLDIIFSGEGTGRSMSERPGWGAAAVHGAGAVPPSGKMLSVAEYYDDKQPRSGPDKVLVLTMYAEQYESRDKVTLTDIRRLLRKARLVEPSNLSRDVSVAVRKGYLLDIGNGEYQVTKKGMDIMKGEGSGKFARKRRV